LAGIEEVTLESIKRETDVRENDSATSKARTQQPKAHTQGIPSALVTQLYKREVARQTNRT
jgi:hypothetical protein